MRSLNGAAATPLRSTLIARTGSLNAVQDLERRIIRVYQFYTGTDSEHGALAWFARSAYVTKWTVTRWLSGRRAFRGPALALLEQLETQVPRANGR